MDKEQDAPQKRFQDYIQVFNAQGVAIGFTLPTSDFLFKYDENGGWKDQKGNYYNSKGVLQKVADGHSDDQDDQDFPDEQELQEFQKMLDDDTEVKKQKKENQNQSKKQIKKNVEQNYQTETAKFLQNYKQKKQIRQGLPQQLIIFYKMRSKFYQRINPKVQKCQSTQQINSEIKKIKQKALQQSNKLKQKNKWIQEGEFQYSGTQLDQATYDRYWYGYIKTNPENYQQGLSQIGKSQQFALLQHKTFYALKSKFYLKKKMQQTIQQLAKKLQGKDDDDLIRIVADNLPQNFPCSFILDLCSYSGTAFEQLYSIKIIDDFSAQIYISKRGALKFLNVEGYCHDDKQYIELTVQEDEKKRKAGKSVWFKISVRTDSQNHYKTHVRELNDTLALEKSKQELVKLYTQQQQNQNGGYRFLIGVNCLKKVLMYRGSSLDVLKIQVFTK